MLDDFPDHLGGARAVIHGHAHLQVAGMIRPLVNLLAERPETAAIWRLIPGEPMTRAQIREVEEQVCYFVTCVLQCGSDREAFSIVEK